MRRLATARPTARRSLSGALRRTLRPLAVLVTGASVVAASAVAYADGVDVSHYQGTVSWSKVDAAGISFAFIKATEGTTYTDPMLKADWSGAAKQGIYRGAYHFARPSTASGSAVAQATYFVRAVGSFRDTGDLPPVLDLEASGNLTSSQLISWVSTWLTTVERLTGRNPMIYVSPSFWTDHLGNSTAFHNYPLWVANYGVSSPHIPGGWPTWTFWQRTSTGSVPGISGYVDMNKFNGTSAGLARMANASGGTTAPPPTGPTVPTGAATALTVRTATTSPVIGSQVHLSGTLMRITPSTAVVGRAVSLWSRPVGTTTWSQAATGSTDSTGGYDLAATVSRAADYQVRWMGGRRYAPAVSPVVRLAPVPAATAIDLHKNVANPRRGAALSLYGTLTRGGVGTSGLLVRYYKRAVHGTTWLYVGSSHSAAPSGGHSLVVHPQIARVWKAVFAGSTASAPSTSALLTVRPR